MRVSHGLAAPHSSQNRYCGCIRTRFSFKRPRQGPWRSSMCCQNSPSIVPIISYEQAGSNSRAGQHIPAHTCSSGPESGLAEKRPALPVWEQDPGYTRPAVARTSSFVSRNWSQTAMLLVLCCLLWGCILCCASEGLESQVTICCMAG
jgi:hypothetical protein